MAGVAFMLLMALGLPLSLYLTYRGWAELYRFADLARASAYWVSSALILAGFTGVITVFGGMRDILLLGSFLLLTVVVNACVAITGGLFCALTLDGIMHYVARGALALVPALMLMAPWTLKEVIELDQLQTAVRTIGWSLDGERDAGMAMPDAICVETSPVYDPCDQLSFHRHQFENSIVYRRTDTGFQVGSSRPTVLGLYAVCIYRDREQPIPCNMRSVPLTASAASFDLPSTPWHLLFALLPGALLEYGRWLLNNGRRWRALVAIAGSLATIWSLGWLQFTDRLAAYTLIVTLGIAILACIEASERYRRWDAVAVWLLVPVLLCSVTVWRMSALRDMQGTCILTAIAGTLTPTTPDELTVKARAARGSTRHMYRCGVGALDRSFFITTTDTTVDLLMPVGLPGLLWARHCSMPIDGNRVRCDWYNSGTLADFWTIHGTFRSG